MKKNLKQFSRYGLLIFAILVSFLPILNPLQIFSNLQNYSFDTLQRLLPREIYAEDPVVIIDIDDRSLAEIGQWPWSRNQLAKLTNQAYAAAALGFDIVFAEPDRTNPQNFISSYPLNESLKKELSALPSNDELFAQAITDHGTVVLGQALNNKNNIKPSKTKFGLVTQGDDPKQFITNYSGIQNNIKELESSAAGVGSMSIGNNDAIVRQLPTFERVDDQLVPSLALEMTRVAVGASTFQIKSSNASSEEAYGAQTGINNIKLGPLSIPTTPEGNAWVYFAPSRDISTVSAADVISGVISPDFFEGKVALVGTSAAGLLDLRSTPTEKNVPGVTIIAQFIQQIFANEFLQRPDWLFGAEFIAGLLLAVLITLGIQVLGPIGGLSIFLVGSGGIMGSSYYFFKSKLFLVDPISPLIISLSVYVAVTFFNFLFTELERSRVRGAFAQYLSPEMVNRLAESSESLVLGGERKEMTFLFSDIRGFTKISEQYKDDPEALTQLINELLTVLSNAILEHGGTIDKYMGDCIMAFWNAPTDQADHRQLAIQAAHSMNEALDEFNLNTEGSLDFKLEIGIGINSGNCIVGNMGSDKRFDYTVLGDAVNLASRLESQSSNYGLHMIVGENTYMNDSDFTMIEIDKIAVKGKSTAETIYTCFKSGMKLPEGFIDNHASFLAEYRAQNWNAANLLIDELMSSSNELELYYRHMKARIEKYITNPPSADWGGVYVATNK
ncbi:adenylate/guanylate cyclase domain-containing protein [Gammaproteobacteria bacterium]|nr:adenylate/guanylate cyclase domain-containing protein [Gammaproteobacteria bacterium]MDC0885392.1 adenylate/guanylate cyclase domain-containing protein [Gammaproteobacteria bacterium]MDC1021527.1 adenylate/guanylate cyclase domain-containing protein [Gammaproteobacteria bacterium]